MYLCICRAITEETVKESIQEGLCSLPALQNRLGVAQQCGQCQEDIVSLLEEAMPPDVVPQT